jgi:hypothetical protein
MSRRVLTLLLAAFVVPLAAALALWSVTPSNADTTSEPIPTQSPKITSAPYTPTPTTTESQIPDKSKCGVCGGWTG